MVWNRKNKTRGCYHLRNALILLFILPAIAGNTQVTRSVYFHENLPSSSVLNPAFHPNCNFYFNLPVISTFYIGFESPFSFNQLTTKYPEGDSLFIDREAVIDVLKPKNYFSFELYNEIGRAGFRVKRHFFHASIAKVFSTKFSFDKDLIALFLYGNAHENFFGKKVSFSKMGLNMTSYHEFSLGYSFEINEKLTVGTRLKYLNGAFNIWTERAEFTLHTDDASNYALTASSDILLHTSSTISDFDNLIDQVEGYRWFDLSENHGYGFDLGVEFKPNDKLKFTASVTDLGWIGWRENVKNFTSANPGEEYEFNGFDIDDFIEDDSFSDSFDFTDTLRNHFQLMEDNKPYTSRLNPKVYLGGLWYLNKRNELGLLIRTDLVENNIQPSFTLNYSRNIGRFLTAFGNYSILNRNIANIGFGLIIRTGPVQIYGMTDIVYGVFTPAETPNYNFQVGINLLFGTRADKYKGIPAEELNAEPAPENE